MLIRSYYIAYLVMKGGIGRDKGGNGAGCLFGGMKLFRWDENFHSGIAIPFPPAWPFLGDQGVLRPCCMRQLVWFLSHFIPNILFYTWLV